MSVPRDKDAKRFYIAARRRLDDARALLAVDHATDHTTGSMYLAGYTVECMLKALIIVQATSTRKPEVLKEFHGSGAHNFDRLRAAYLRLGGTGFPKNVVESFLVVQEWGTDWRYDPAPRPADDAESFLASVARIWDCIDKRL